MSLAKRLAPAFLITEDRGFWVKASVLSSFLEVSVDDWRFGRTLLPGVPVTYLGIWQGRRCHYEFQLGTHWGAPPALVATICGLLHDWRP